jgi:hypothetical protein
LGGPVNCITFTATDLAGNTSTCMSYIDLRPFGVVVGGAPPGPFGVATAVEPANLTLSVAGLVTQLARVDYYANGVLIGSGGPGMPPFAWNKVPAGSYSIVAVGTTAGASPMSASSDPVFVYIQHAPATPKFSAVFVQYGRLALTVQTTKGESCVIETCADLSGSWQTLQEMVGDGDSWTVRVPINEGCRFFRVRILQ